MCSPAEGQRQRVLFFYREIFPLLIFNHCSETEEECVRTADRGEEVCLRGAGVRCFNALNTLIGTPVHHCEAQRCLSDYSGMIDG